MGYYSIFFILTLISFFYLFKRFQKIIFLNILTFVLLSTFVGLRDEVGRDWKVYENLFQQFKSFGFPSIQIFKTSDPLYITLNILAERSGFNIHTVNFIISIIFFFSLYVILDNHKYKIISLTSGFLLLVVILGMGYTRQALAVSFMLIFYKSFIEKKYIISLAFAVLAISSHKTSTIYIIAMIFLFLISNKNVLKLKYLLPLLLLLSLFTYHYQVDLLRLFNIYIYREDLILSENIEQHIISPGAIFKAAILILFLIIYFIFFKKIKFKNYNEELIFNSLVILIIFPIPFLGYFSSFVDRLLVYSYILIPLSIHKILSSNIFSEEKNKLYFYVFIIVFSFLNLSIWLEYANHSSYWLPYKNIILIKYFF